MAGQPPHKPTEKTKEHVAMLARFGVPQARIAEHVGISLNTLKAHYREQLDNAVEKANAQVANSLFNQAMRGNIAACIFWLKTRAGWKEPQTAAGENSGTILELINAIKKSK